MTNTNDTRQHDHTQPQNAAELQAALKTHAGRSAFEAAVQYAMTHCYQCGAAHEIGAETCPNGHDLSLPF